MTRWHVYIVHCNDDTCTQHHPRRERRVDEHNTSNLLAASYALAAPGDQYRSPRGRLRGEQARLELKQMTRREKDALIAGAKG